MSQVIWPMKCKSIKTQRELEKVISTDQYAIEEKIKGVRGVIHISNGQIHVFSRGSSKFEPDKPIELTHRLPHFEMSKTTLERLDGFILDCELYTPELDDSEIAGKLNARSMLPTDERIKAYIFDIISDINEGIDFSSNYYRCRKRMLNELFRKHLEELPWIKRPRWLGSGHSNKAEEFISEILDNGGEGVVLKNINSDYIFTEKNFKRANYWYKYKRKDTIDAKIIGAKPPEKFYKQPETRVIDFSRPTKFYEMGWIGSIEFEYTVEYENGFAEIHTGFCSGMTDNLRAKLTDPKHRHQLNPEYLGSIIEVEYFEMNQYGNLEHPRLKRVRLDLEK
jgi:ATP-dependent DNA ligase